MCRPPFSVDDARTGYCGTGCLDQRFYVAWNKDLVFSLCLIKMVFVIGSFTGPRTLVLPGRVIGGRVWLQPS